MKIKISSLLKHIIPSSVVQHKLCVKGSLLFTFDDGPHPEITPRVLDILDENGALGLFFITSTRTKRAPSLINEIIRRNHKIGNHSFSHYPCSSLSFQEIIKEIENCKRDIFDISGIETDIYRPPMGVITPSLILAAMKCNHKILRWSIDTGEYSHMKNSSYCQIADRFISKVKDKAIVLSHDDNEKIPKFLKIALPAMIDKGFDLKKGLFSLTTKKR